MLCHISNVRGTSERFYTKHGVVVGKAESLSFKGQVMLLMSYCLFWRPTAALLGMSWRNWTLWRPAASEELQKSTLGPVLLNAFNDLEGVEYSLEVCR